MSETTGFPIETLPPQARQFVSEAAASFAVDQGLPATLALVTLGAAIGTKRRIVIKTDWKEFPLLWGCVVAPPGSAKSPLLHAVEEPLAERDRMRYEEWHARHELWKSTDKKVRDDEPQLDRFTIHDATTEALAALLARTPTGLLLSQDELSGLVSGMNQYKGGRGSDRAWWLKVWASAAASVDRKGSEGQAKVLYVPEPFVAVMGGTQPRVVRELDPRELHDGFLDRFLWATQDGAGTDYTEAQITLDAKRAWADLVGSLLDLPKSPDHYTLGQEPEVAAREVWLDDEARDVWAAEHRRHADQLRDAALDPRLPEPYSKMPRQAARLALTLHIADGERYWLTEKGAKVVVPVTADAMRRAWRIVDYYKAQVAAVRRLIAMTPRQRRGAALVKWLAARPDRQATCRQVIKAEVGGMTTMAELEEAVRDQNSLGLVTVDRVTLPADNGIRGTTVLRAAAPDEEAAA